MGSEGNKAVTRDENVTEALTSAVAAFLEKRGGQAPIVLPL